MHTIAILNSKGGSGKTTISTNLASYYAQSGRNTVLIDYDSQGSSTFWIGTRSEEQPYIHSIPAYQHASRQTQSFHMKLASGTERVIIDSPAAVSRLQLDTIVKRSDFIVIPVMPSSIDIHAVRGFIEQLRQLNLVRCGKVRLAVVASRSNENTDIYNELEQHLVGINIPFVAKIRDTQNYVHSANEGKGIFEMVPMHKVGRDKSDWHPLINWIEQKEVFSELKSVSAGVGKKGELDQAS